MKKVSELHMRVIDKGLFIPIARRLARDVAKVTYWSPSEKSFPTVRDSIGDGFEDFDRVESPWEDKESVDAWVFPDVGFAHLQAELVSQGRKVWGAGFGDRLELSRAEFLATLKESGLPVAKYHVAVGITELKEFLHDKKDQWVKISKFRGDFETFHWRSWEEDENRLNFYSVKFGPFREQITFYVFEPIETTIEDGSDLWCINGEYPGWVIHGMEHKDKAFLCGWQKYDDLPDQIRDINEAFAPFLKRYGYRSFFSTEVRVAKDGTPYFIDPTCRAGSPPSQLMTEMIANYGEVIWGGANGVLVEPEPAAKCGAQVILSLKRDQQEWGCMALPDELDRWIKCGNCVMDEGHLWFPQEYDRFDPDVGWLIGIGDLMDEPIRHLQHNVKLLPDGACCDLSPIADLLKEAQEAEEKGMTFPGDRIPSPSIILEQDK